jgi:lysine 2,3-aminomutase
MSPARDTVCATPDLKPPADADRWAHRQLRGDDFWRRLPGYRDLSAAQFHDHRFQSRNCVTNVAKLREVLGPGISPAFYEDAAHGVLRSTMSLRISPYIVSLIDWEQPYDDPLRLQFLPLASRFEPDHPELTLDSLHEQEDSPVPGLTHRYADRALFLTLDTCPVYCRFCTRSYAIGLDTPGVEKRRFSASQERWEQAFAYLARRPEVEDVVVSGGDVYNLRPEQLEYVAMRLLDIEHIRRLRLATKGPAVMPQKLLTDEPWMAALTRVVETGRRRHKEVALHTHFNHPREVTEITSQGLDRLMERGIVVRNQTVLQRGVNDHPPTMQMLIQRLSHVNVHPYYVFVHDLVRGVEELRTSLQAAMDLEKQVRGATAGFNTPAFVVDTLGGGGKRQVHSCEHYDREHGIAVFTSPAVSPGRLFLFFDPIRGLSPGVQADWRDPVRRQGMIAAALEVGGAGRRQINRVGNQT